MDPPAGVLVSQRSRSTAVAAPSPERPSTPALLTAVEVADLLAVPESWVRRETRANRLPHVQLGRYRRYRHEDIEAFAAERTRGPVPGPRPGGRPRV